MAIERWERRFVADPERAREVAEVYRLAGFDVRVETEIPEGLRDECTDCWLAKAGYFRVIYTRHAGREP
ncbi:MAG TPA: hypothetical protein VJ816_09605 [Gemmatimonadales bacterium]|nr:hypothetical protein [Gemmatimonadales bacterium]